jgi:hypothetical protein
MVDLDAIVSVIFFPFRTFFLSFFVLFVVEEWISR